MPLGKETDHLYGNPRPAQFAPPDGWILPRDLLRLKLEDFNPVAVFGCIGELRNSLAKCDDLTARIKENEAALGSLREAIQQARETPGASEPALAGAAVIEGRLPVLEKRLELLAGQMKAIGDSLCIPVRLLLCETRLMCELIFHGQVTIANSSDVSPMGPWEGTEITTLCFAVLNRPEHRDSSREIEVQDIFDLAQRSIDNAELIFSELCRLERIFQPDAPTESLGYGRAIPIRRLGCAICEGPGAGGKGRFTNPKRALIIEYAYYKDLPNGIMTTTGPGDCTGLLLLNGLWVGDTKATEAERLKSL
jgi:hypothetical protein